MTDERASLRATRYTDSMRNYRETFAFPSMTFANENAITAVSSSAEFDKFTLRENGTCLVFFAHGKDPDMQRILSILQPMASQTVKLVIADVELLKELSVRFAIRAPTLLKVYKGKIMNRFSLEFTAENISRFIHIPSTARWRSVDGR